VVSVAIGVFAAIVCQVWLEMVVNGCSGELIKYANLINGYASSSSVVSIVCKKGIRVYMKPVVCQKQPYAAFIHINDLGFK
jgi:hypothetical protein